RRKEIFDWLHARKEGGHCSVRLEDTDRTPWRYVPEGIAEIEASMRFLGIVPDEWWVGGGPCAPYVQSQRLERYREVAELLVAQGHAYRCYCTRERLEQMRLEQQERGLPTGYDRHCREPERRERLRQMRRDQEGGEPACVVRLAMPLDGVTVLHDEVRGDIVYENRLQDDQVLLKSDGFPTYFLACVVDDHDMGITHVLRGDDWLSSAAKMVQVYRALGWELPKFVHPPLIVGPDRKKLSKRHGATDFRWFMEEGYLPEALFNFLALLGWSAGEENRELFSIAELIERFSIEGISDSPAVFDYEKLRWMNGHYIRKSDPGRIIGLCLPYLRRAGLVPEAPRQEPGESDKAFEARREQYRVEWLEYVRRVIPLEIERMKTLAEVTDLVGFFFQDLDFPHGYDEKAVQKWLRVPYLGVLLDREIVAFEGLAEWTTEALEGATRSIAEELGLKFGDVVHPTRVAATGRTVGPGLFETLWAMGRERTLSRLRAVRERAPGTVGS
ncbi:MAG: glutamate--tRNA ligase, partial [Chloroherpetonaceae bacterium]|nr:glutamate--tRNA ligase [Chthonomonadaceae bacterium]MDW8208541.1 glutamate--tRNA ligase [Chloroherpetonaceae bacterium]